jgi:hypothetical protein
MLNQTEKNVLKKIAESHLITKPELRKYLETNGAAVKDASSVVDGITRRLMEQRLISTISPVGSTCFIITQRGNQFLKELEI